ncbi:hypothetical protein NQZ68_002320 [Dissostichus eleginoides]|nr:hypothetical protein NQZ68_002320 [Dissostichus eleginoides]
MAYHVRKKQLGGERGNCLVSDSDVIRQSFVRGIKWNGKKKGHLREASYILGHATEPVPKHLAGIGQILWSSSSLFPRHQSKRVVADPSYIET